MPPRPLPLAALVLALALVGCAERGPSASTLHSVYDWARGERIEPLRVGEDADALEATLALFPRLDGAPCAPGDARVRLVDPDGRVAAEVGPAAGCRNETFHAERPVAPGEWRVEFLGNGTLTGAADLRERFDPEGRAYAPGPR